MALLRLIVLLPAGVAFWVHRAEERHDAAQGGDFSKSDQKGGPRTTRKGSRVGSPVAEEDLPDGDQGSEGWLYEWCWVFYASFEPWIVGLDTPIGLSDGWFENSSASSWTEWAWSQVLLFVLIGSG